MAIFQKKSQVMERHDTSRGQLVDSLGGWELPRNMAVVFDLPSGYD